MLYIDEAIQHSHHFTVHLPNKLITSSKVVHNNLINWHPYNEGTAET